MSERMRCRLVRQPVRDEVLMSANAVDTTSYWMETGPLPRYPALDRDLEVDVVVIGGGITGITDAYLIKQSGKTVALVDRRRFASVDTGHTTAHLTFVTDLG